MLKLNLSSLSYNYFSHFFAGCVGFFQRIIERLASGIVSRKVPHRFKDCPQEIHKNLLPAVWGDL